MQIYISDASSIYSKIFIFIEYLLIIIFLLVYLKKINDLIKFPNILYDKIDIIIIFLSAFQLFLFLIRLIKNYSIFSILISINKFSQNLMILTLLIIYILGKYEKGKATIIKYFFVTLLIFDIALFLIDINDSQPFDTKNDETISNLILYIFCLCFDCFICYKSYINKKNLNDKIDNNFESNKLDNIIKKDQKLLGEEINNKEQKEIFNENENEFINTIYFQNLNNVIIIISIYFYILVSFLISYFIDIILYLSFKINNSDNIYNNRNETNYNNTISNNNTETNMNDQEIISSKKYSFPFLNFIFCFIFFFFRDILPYLVIYLMFFIYKRKFYHRASF